MSNGEQVNRMAGLAVKARKSVDFTGYQQISEPPLWERPTGWHSLANFHHRFSHCGCAKEKSRLTLGQQVTGGANAFSETCGHCLHHCLGKFYWRSSCAGRVVRSKLQGVVYEDLRALRSSELFRANSLRELRGTRVRAERGGEREVHHLLPWPQRDRNLQMSISNI